MTDKFTLWFAEEKGDVPRKLPREPYNEPAAAADAAENVLARGGIGGESFVEIRFNGDKEPHSVIFLLDDSEPPTYGIWNTPSALWPIYYPDSPYGTMLEGNPFEDSPEGDGANEDDGKHKKDDDSDKMDLGGQDDEDDDDEDYDDDENDEEDGDDEESEADENEEEEQDDESDDEGEEEAGDEDEESDDEVEDDDRDESDGDDEKEIEMPRLNIFGKMRGPKGWRKRAEAEELNERNVFGLKIGILDAEAEKPGAQERHVVAHVEFIESDETRDHGILKLRLPDDVTLADFTQTKAGVITVKVPYGEA